MFGLGFERLVEMALCLCHVAAFVLLEAAQEMVECAVRLDMLRRRTFLLRGPGDRRPAPGKLPASSGTHAWVDQRAGSLVPGSRAPDAGLPSRRFARQRLGHGFRHHHQHLVAAAGNLIALLFIQ